MPSKILPIFCCITLILTGCRNDSTKRPEFTPKDGELNRSFNDSDFNVVKEEIKFEAEKAKLLAQGWKEEELNNGQLPNCYNFKPKRGGVENYLEVHVGGGADVAVKVINATTDVCVRYVFVNSGSTYAIKNIPAAKYYLKIAYGKNWLSKIDRGKCVGKFLRNPIYEKGKDIIDFNTIEEEDGISIPSYRLNLDVVSNQTDNSFDSNAIDEDEFNN